jgi:putrescine transport system permease protein
VSPARVGETRGKPFLLGELMAWIRAHGPWRRAAVGLRALGLTGRTLVTGVPYLWLLLFFLVPFLIVLKISVSEIRLAMPPYEPLFTWISDYVVGLRINFENYAFLFKDSLYWKSFLNSISTAAISTVACLLIGYPMAYGIARSPAAWRNVLLLLVMLPFWTSFLLRVYAWIGILKNNGVINNVLMALGIIDEPILMLQTNFAMYIGIVYSYLPFMVLPLYTAIERLDDSLLEAAADLGCRPVKTYFCITVPLTRAGIIAGCMLVFIPAVGEFVIPALLGGPDALMIGRVLWEEFFNNRDWPVASAVAIVMLFVLVIPIMIYQRSQGQQLGAHR